MADGAQVYSELVYDNVFNAIVEVAIFEVYVESGFANVTCFLFV